MSVVHTFETLSDDVVVLYVCECESECDMMRVVGALYPLLLSRSHSGTQDRT